MNKQPKALYLLNFVSMWECFSYYGMRVLLVLYMVHQLHYREDKAFGMYALYTTLVELGSVVGGIAADRFLGLKKSIVIGGIIIALGHLSLTFSDLFFLGLGFIIVGTSLFRSNVPAFLGQFYDEHDPRKERGYSLYYIGINLGGFLASILCGIVGEVYGWHAGFGLASFGMISGLIVLFMGRKIMLQKCEIKPSMPNAVKWGAFGAALAAPVAALMIYHYQVVTLLVPFGAALLLYYIWREIRASSALVMENYKKLALYLVFLILFYGCEEQLGSTLLLFGERHVERGTIFGAIPAASLITFNPLTILLIGPLFSKIVEKIRLESLTKIGISFAFLAAAFAILYAASLFPNKENEILLFYAIVSIILISLGELLLAPTVYLTASEIAPKSLSGLIMGAVSLGYSLANLFSGLLSQMMAVTTPDESLHVYMRGFITIAISAAALSCIIIYQRKKVYAK